jgi:hypothetical protein
VQRLASLMPCPGAPVLGLIHRSAWKGGSPKFALFLLTKIIFVMVAVTFGRRWPAKVKIT